MPFDNQTSPQKTAEAKPTSLSDEGMRDSEQTQWSTIKHQLARKRKNSPRKIFGKAARDGAIYRWGVGVANGGPIDPLTLTLSRLACTKNPGDHDQLKNELCAIAESYVDLAHPSASMTTLEATQTVLWASALPALVNHLSDNQWWRLLSSLQQLRESILQRSRSSCPSHLIIGGELGLTLASGVGSLPSCEKLDVSSAVAIKQWADESSHSLTAAIEDQASTRLVLASLIRCNSLLRSLKKSKSKGRIDSAMLLGDQLATWVAAMTIHTGGSAFSSAKPQDVIDDLGPHGLLAKAARFDRESLPTAISVALGRTPDGGRLSWQVNLPETIHHNEEAKVAVFMADWDVRRGRTHLDYSGDNCRLEVFSGKTKVISGDWQTLIQVDGIEQQPAGEWSEVCEHSDDDVHYLEIDQRWTGGIVLERQIMLVRDDRCLYIADAVLPGDPADKENRNIKYACRLPLASGVNAGELPETRDLFLQKTSRSSKKRTPSKDLALVMPLSASEWRVGPTAATLRQTDDDHLLLSTEGNGRLYAPMWMDFQKRRFERDRTWRTLTIAEQLRTVGRNEAAGYRVQIGSEQWMIYRSLTDPASRTVLGKHLVAGFFASRFDTGDGGHEVLVKVDDNEAIDEE